MSVAATRTPSPLAPSNSEIDLTTLSAVELVRRQAAGQLSAVGILDAYLERIHRLNPSRNAIVCPLFDEARASAARIDADRARGVDVGPLAGVPITIKESFEVLGTPATIGMARRKTRLASSEGPVVRQLRAAGAVIVGKTNVPQMMLSNDTDNRVYGRTPHPLRDDRGPGGSSGGEAAAIALRFSALGLGSDLLGSIRQPAHVCGIHGFKPTMPRFSMIGGVNALGGGLEAIMVQPGPMGRHICDLSAFCDVLARAEVDAHHDVHHHGNDPYTVPAPWRDPRQVDIARLRIGVWEDDPIFTPSPGIRRVVRESADALAALGAEIVPYAPFETESVLRMCLALISCSGARNVRSMLDGERPIHNVARTLRVWGMSGWQRSLISGICDAVGQPWRAKLIRWCRAGSASDYWDLVNERKEYVRRATDDLHRRKIDVILAPPNGLPALLHDTSSESLPASVFAYHPNLLGLPSGTVAASSIRDDEGSTRNAARETLTATARRIEQGSAGLPIGVQVSARLWRDDVCLAVMEALERHFASRPDYPPNMVDAVVR
jgi:fatty acid amide hydrolase